MKPENKVAPVRFQLTGAQETRAEYHPNPISVQPTVRAKPPEGKVPPSAAGAQTPEKLHMFMLYSRFSKRKTSHTDEEDTGELVVAGRRHLLIYLLAGFVLGAAFFVVQRFGPLERAQAEQAEPKPEEPERGKCDVRVRGGNVNVDVECV